MGKEDFRALNLVLVPVATLIAPQLPSAATLELIRRGWSGPVEVPLNRCPWRIHGYGIFTYLEP